MCYSMYGPKESRIRMCSSFVSESPTNFTVNLGENVAKEFECLHTVLQGQQCSVTRSAQHDASKQYNHHNTTIHHNLLQQVILNWISSSIFQEHSLTAMLMMTNQEFWRSVLTDQLGTQKESTLDFRARLVGTRGFNELLHVTPSNDMVEAPFQYATIRLYNEIENIAKLSGKLTDWGTPNPTVTENIQFRCLDHYAPIGTQEKERICRSESENFFNLFVTAQQQKVPFDLRVNTPFHINNSQGTQSEEHFYDTESKRFYLEPVKSSPHHFSIKDTHGTDQNLISKRLKRLKPTNPEAAHQKWKKRSTFHSSSNKQEFHSQESNSSFRSQRTYGVIEADNGRNHTQYRTVRPTCRLSQFLRQLLNNPEHNPGLICWVDQPNSTFKLVNSAAVARLWGAHKQKPNMNYETMGRAMRYYYAQNILRKVKGQRLVYQFLESSSDTNSLTTMTNKKTCQSYVFPET